MSIVVRRVAGTAIKSIISLFVKHILLVLTLELTQRVGETTEPIAVTDSFTTSANSIKGRGTVLLQTARAVATNYMLQLSRPVRVLLSQCSYITEAVQS